MENNLTKIQDLLKGKKLPALVLLRGELDKNIDYFINNCLDKKIRIATKSVRCISLLKYINKKLGDKAQGFMCFTAEEAEYCLEEGLDDLLLGYPTFNYSQISKLIPYVKEGKKVCFMTDLSEHLVLLNEIAFENKIVLNICVDLDLSLYLPFLNFGVYRSSIRSINDFKKLFGEIKKYKNLKLIGLMGYEAQVAGVPDYLPGKKIQSFIVSILKKISIKRIARLRLDVFEYCQQESVNLDYFNGGGTGSIHSTCKEAPVTEITIGSGFYTPTLFDRYKNLSLSSSLIYALQVVRKPEANIATCLGGGYVASGALGIEKLPSVVYPHELEMIETEMAGEVQTPLRGADQINIGDVIFFRHAKAGELCEHFSNMLIFDQHANKISEYKTYRGDGKCFL